MLKIATGFGWSAFKVDPTAENCPDPSRWPSISCAIDQGSDGWSAVHYLLSTFHNLCPFFDASHRVWNDVLLALGDAGLAAYTTVALIILRQDSGPWGSTKWWRTVIEGASEYVQVADTKDEIFSGYVDRLRFEKTFAKEHNSEEFTDEQLLRPIHDSVQKQVQKVGMARWFGYITSVRAFLAFGPPDLSSGFTPASRLTC